jgi:S-adenosylmethionine/arginine decarboxylase-like enzyme
MKCYGQELVLDLHECNNVTMDLDIQGFCEELAELVDMQVEDFHIWASDPEDDKDPNLYGISAIQFITTSNITVHTLPLLDGGAAFINLFSCKDFDADVAAAFCREYFDGNVRRLEVVPRG